ncbi:neuferricin [Microplitis demolitor]|uniref:neuferricin n=1 Tax=Microplitis demolitor TaxID=69319 RepID=UPI0004CDB5A5|nr:neuferricin [Microplitis demolitor]
MVHKIKMWIPVILAIGWTLYLNDWTRAISYKLMNGDYVGAYQLYLGHKDKLFSKKELEKYNNIENGLYLSILGQVFDVTKGEQYYGKGNTYHAFVGRDASQAFITGDFTEKGLTDDLSSLTNAQAKSLDNWLKSYHEKYQYKGKLVGKFYDQYGVETLEFHNFKTKVSKAEAEQSDKDKINKKFPPCNVEWNPEGGTRFWCTNQSGGIPREWIGVPRQYYENPSSPQNRCACVDLKSQDYINSKGNFREYKDCAKDATECFVKN